MNVYSEYLQRMYLCVKYSINNFKKDKTDTVYEADIMNLTLQKT